jgi:hypothetical protein
MRLETPAEPLTFCEYPGPQLASWLGARRDHAQDQKHLAEAPLGADQDVAEEEERDPLELLTKATEDLEQAVRVRVERLHDHGDGERDHPRPERGYCEALLGREQPGQPADDDCEDEDVAHGRRGPARGEQLHRSVEQAEVQNEDRDRHLVAGGDHQREHGYARRDDAHRDQHARVGNPNGYRQRQQERDQRGCAGDRELLAAAPQQRWMRAPGRAGEARPQRAHRPRILANQERRPYPRERP